MARTRDFKILVCDFETTVYEGQTSTEVWASACVELYTDNVVILHSIDETFEYFRSLKTNLICYYTNLKFDGSFWISYFLRHKKFKQAIIQKSDEENDIKWVSNKDMKSYTFKYSISDRGMWYTITVKIDKFIIEFRDTLKILPFSVKALSDAFKTSRKKLDMEYKGFRYPGCVISDKEREYISNDVLIPKEALEITFAEGHDKLTIGSCCLSEYKKIMGKDYDILFPNLYRIAIPSKYGEINAGEWIRHSYKGGWCYVLPEKTNKILHNGLTLDVNSLYPSMMHSESGNRYPVGYPTFWKGNKIPDEATKKDRYYFIRIKTRFYIKEGYLPFVQIKGSMLYKGTECLESSDIEDKETGLKTAFIKGKDGSIKDTRVILTMTHIDYKLFIEHYNVVDFEILDGCWFETELGIFDLYINRYKKQKIESKGGLRTLAKLFLNNLYGKMASSTDSSFKYCYLKEDESFGFISIDEHDKAPGYIAVGSAITSYSRNFTIRAAQLNYHGPNKPGFVYADTDSIHTDSKEIRGIKLHESNFNCWKKESQWDIAIFVRQKTYLEHITHEGDDKLENPYYDIKCAGMPDKCKDLFRMSIGEKDIPDNLSEEEQLFVNCKRDITDFKRGLIIPGKLMPKRIKGGVLLVETTYEMR